MASQIECHCSHPGTSQVNDLWKVTCLRPVHCVLYVFKCGETGRTYNGCEAGDTRVRLNRTNELNFSIFSHCCASYYVYIPQVVGPIHVWTTLLWSLSSVSLHGCNCSLILQRRRCVTSRKCKPSRIRFRSSDHSDHYLPLMLMLLCVARDCRDADGHLFDNA